MVRTLVEWALHLAGGDGQPFAWANVLAALFGAGTAAASFEAGRAGAPAAYCVVRAWDAQGVALVEYVDSPERAEQRKLELADQHPDWHVILDLTVV